MSMTMLILIYMMQSDKISLIDSLKNHEDSFQIRIEHFLVILHQNAITLNQTRRFLLQKQIANNYDWRSLTNEQILNISEESYSYIINHRAQWIQQRKIYENNLLKFHHLFQQVAAKSQNLRKKSKTQLLESLKHQNSLVKDNILKEQEMKSMIDHLEAIIEFEKQASKYSFSNDYESNQLINNILEQISERTPNQNAIKSTLSRKNIVVSPVKKLKTSPGSLIKSKSVGQYKINTESSQYLARKYSQKSTKLNKERKNFIQQIREEIKNDQMKKSIPRSYSDQQSKLTGNNRLVSVHLPKILKLSDDQLSSQGIYKSLKKFANFDYVAQQKKIRDIIGISLGQDEQYMSAYFSKQMMVKQQKQQEQQAIRQERRKKILESLSKKQHHCKKYNPQEVQPYMRF